MIGTDRWYVGMFEYAQPQDAAHDYLRIVRDSDPATATIVCLKETWYDFDYSFIGMPVTAIAQACGANMEVLADVIEKTYEDEMRCLSRWKDGHGIARSLLVLEWHDKVTGETEPYTVADFPRIVTGEIRNYLAGRPYGSEGGV